METARARRGEDDGMHLPSVGDLRSRFLLTLVGVLLVAAGAPALISELGARQQHVTDHLAAAAARMNDPAGATSLTRGQCPDQTYLIRCMRVARDADSVAAEVRANLSAAVGVPAGLTCDTLPYGRRPRSCLVRVDQGDHAVLVSVDSDLRRVDGELVLSGSRVRVDVD